MRSSLGQEDPLKEEMAMHSRILARKTPWTEGPGVTPNGHKELDKTYQQGGIEMASESCEHRSRDMTDGQKTLVSISIYQLLRCLLSWFFGKQRY